MSTKKSVKCKYGISDNLFECAKLEFDGLFDVAIFPKGMSIYHGSTSLASNLISFPVGRYYYDNITNSYTDDVNASIIAHNNEQDIAEALTQYGKPTPGWFADPTVASLYPSQADASIARDNCTLSRNIKGIPMATCLLAYKFREDTKIIRLDTVRNLQTLENFIKNWHLNGGENYQPYLEAFYGGVPGVLSRNSKRTHDMKIAEFMCILINHHSDRGYAGYGAQPLYSMHHKKNNTDAYSFFHQELVLCNAIKTLVRDYNNPIDWQYQPLPVEMNITLEEYIEDLKTVVPLNYKKYAGGFYENAVWCSIFSERLIIMVNSVYNLNLPITFAGLLFFYNYREFYKSMYYNYIKNTTEPVNVDIQMVNRTIQFPKKMLENLKPIMDSLRGWMYYLHIYWNIQNYTTIEIEKVLNGVQTMNVACENIIQRVCVEVGRQLLNDNININGINPASVYYFVIVATISDLYTRNGFPNFANPINTTDFSGNLSSSIFPEIKNVSKLLYPGSGGYTKEAFVELVTNIVQYDENTSALLTNNYCNHFKNTLDTMFVFNKLFIDFITGEYLYGSGTNEFVIGNTIDCGINFEYLNNLIISDTTIPELGTTNYVNSEAGYLENTGDDEQDNHKKNCSWWWIYYMAINYVTPMKIINQRLFAELPTTINMQIQFDNTTELVKGALYMVRPIMKIVFEEYSNLQYPNLRSNPPRINHNSLNHLRSLYFTAFTLTNTTIIRDWNLTVNDVTAILIASICKSIGRTNEKGVFLNVNLEKLINLLNNNLPLSKSNFQIIPKFENESIGPVLDGKYVSYIKLQPFTVISAFIEQQIFISGYTFEPSVYQHYLVLATLVTPKEDLGYTFDTNNKYGRAKFIDMSALIAIGHYLDHCRPTTGYSQLDPYTEAIPLDLDGGEAKPWIKQFLEKYSIMPDWLDTKNVFFKGQREVLRKSGFIPTGNPEIPLNYSKTTRCPNEFIRDKIVKTDKGDKKRYYVFDTSFVELSTNFDLAWKTIILN